MGINFRILIFWMSFLVFLSKSHAFWWATKETTPQPTTQPEGVRSFPYNQYMTTAAPIPAIPIQVPLQAQFAPNYNVHDVQLVPCWCPVTADDFKKTIVNEDIKNNIQPPE